MKNPLVLPLLLACGLASAAGPTYMSVQVQDGVIRAAASPFGKPVAQVKYGDLVEILAAQGPWMQVKGYGGTTGWMHQNSLTRKKLVAGAGTAQAGAGASSSEIALAGKGFNSDLEKDLRGKNQKLDFASIDRMETWKVSEAESLRFLQDGGVRIPGATP